jgi:hypothetical protein
MPTNHVIFPSSIILMDKFSRVLLDHVVSDAKTPLQHVETAFHEWRTAEEERSNTDAYYHEQYAQKIQIPRAERTRVYEEYCSEKARLREVWRLSPAGEKARAFREWMGYQLPPELLQTGIDNERIYTKNVISI